nr:ABC transporter ATP-binding protein [uncultured Peptostreptococcus sp.]
MISIQNLSKKYNSQPIGRSTTVNYALDNISMDIKEGTITAIIGLNGSGKTSLLKSIMGFIRPSSGSITVDGEKLSHRLYNKMVYVPDCQTHFPSYSVDDLIYFYKDFYENFNDKKADEMLDYFNIKRTDIIDQLSKGNIAKIKLVMALSLNMKYILLDEPFSGIDVFKRKEFVSIIGRYMGEDQSLILSTHQIDDIESIVDYVHILREGCLVASFNAEDMRLSEGKSILDKLREVNFDGTTR